MKTVWKYALYPEVGQVSIFMPAEAEILSVTEQDGEIVLYALVNPSNLQEYRVVFVVWTGHEVPRSAGKGEASFVGTVRLHSGELMLHVFAV